MYISRIVDYNEDAQEATVIVSDGHYQLMCYAQPFSKKEKFTLMAYNCSNIMTCECQKYEIIKSDIAYFSYKLQGKLLDKERGIVQIGNIVIESVVHLPKDIKTNSFIQFEVFRVDLVQ